jgi:glucokinase
MTSDPRPTRGFALSSVAAPAPVLALDLGGTQVRAAVILPDGSRLGRTAATTPVGQGLDAVIRACAAALEEARRSAGSGEIGEIVGIGISAPGPVDPRNGVVVEPPNLGPDFADVPLAAEMEARLGLPAYLDRDTNVALLGERAFGAARGVADVVYLTISTGVGGAVLSNGALLHGPDGMAGELGHLAIELGGPRCGCGGFGHVEAIASGAALAREARDAVSRNASPFLAARAAQVGADGLSARDVAAGDAAGDPVCAALLSRVRRAVAAACVSIANAFNPHRIIIGGSIATGQGERMLATVRAAVTSEVFRAIGRRVEIVAPLLGDDVSLVGALPLVLDRRSDAAWRGGRPQLTTNPTTDPHPATEAPPT